MITLYSYPQLFGLPDNNPFGLKVDTFLRLAKIPFQTEHIIDTKDAPRGQLPYIIDQGTVITESNFIIKYLLKKYDILLDLHLTESQKNIYFLITRMLDSHLYWVMSYSRWQDERYWPLFKSEFLKQLPQLSEEDLERFRQYNIQKYYYQGIGKYSSEEIYNSGIDDLKCINEFLNNNPFFFGEHFSTIDACCYGFLANIYYFEINTPLRDFIKSQKKLEHYVHRIRERFDY